MKAPIEPRESALVEPTGAFGRSSARAPLVALRPLDRVRGTPHSALLRQIGLAVVLALLVVPSLAHASEARKILRLCGESKPLSGFSQKAYREALKQMETELVEYSECQREISEAERKAAGEGSSGFGTSAGAAGPGGLTNTPIPLTPAESKAVESAHHRGSAVPVGGAPIHPGVVHADIASAVNKLPRSLLAMLALLTAGALTTLALEARKRVNARRNG